MNDTKTDQIIRILKQRDEYPLSIEISNDNAKGEPRITVKARFDTDVTEAELEEKIKICREAWQKQQNLLTEIKT